MCAFVIGFGFNITFRPASILLSKITTSENKKSCFKNIPERFENLVGPAFLREAREHHQRCHHHRRSGCRICLASNRLQPFGCSSWSWFEGNPGVALDSRGRDTSSQAPENKRLGQLMPSFWLVVGISGKAYGCSCWLHQSQKRQTLCQSSLLLMRQSFESLNGDPVSRRGWKVVLQTFLYHWRWQVFTRQYVEMTTVHMCNVAPIHDWAV